MKQASSQSLSFPHGWFCIGYSHELPTKTVKPLYYFGKNLVLFRTENGNINLFDAYCPHLGAHLGYGGKVIGENIQCPFHGWCFNQEGECNHIPYTDKIPARAKTNTWPVKEVNGLIMVYYHSQGKLPDWEIPELPEYTSQEWTPLSLAIRRKSPTYAQEIGEGSIVDTAHFGCLHPYTFHRVKGEDLAINGTNLSYKMYPDYNLSGVAKMLNIEGKTSIDFTSYGLGCIVVRSCSQSLIEIRTFTMFLLTPIDREYIDFHFLVSIKKIMNKPITFLLEQFTRESAVKTLQEDIQIWENKIYRPHPLLCEGDGPIAQYRRWASQFYLQDEPRLKITVQHS